MLAQTHASIDKSYQMVMCKEDLNDSVQCGFSKEISRDALFVLKAFHPVVRPSSAILVPLSLSIAL